MYRQDAENAKKGREEPGAELDNLAYRLRLSSEQEYFFAALFPLQRRAGAQIVRNERIVFEIEPLRGFPARRLPKIAIIHRRETNSLNMHDLPRDGNNA